MLQSTSVSAFLDLLGDGTIHSQERRLLRLWLEHPTGISDRELEQLSGVRANAISARRAGLIMTWVIQKYPMQFASTNRRCTVTGRTVKAWRIVQGTAAQQEFDFRRT